MADYDFENPTFDPDGPGIDDYYSFDLPDAIMDPPLRIQQNLNTSGDHIQSLRGEFREAEIEAQKKRLVDTFYKVVTQVYGLRHDSIDFDQFRINDDGKTLFWTPGDKKISISTTRGGVRFLALSTLASRYGVGGTDSLRRSLGLTGYTRKGLSSSAVKALQQAGKNPLAMLALTGGGGKAPVPTPKPPDKSGLKEWVKKHLQALGRALANLAGKAAAALSDIIGSIVSWLLSTLGKTATWLAENLWALAIAVGTLLLVAVGDWIARR